MCGKRKMLRMQEFCVIYIYKMMLICRTLCWATCVGGMGVVVTESQRIPLTLADWPYQCSRSAGILPVYRISGCELSRDAVEQNAVA